MHPERRQRLLLGILVVVAAAALYVRWSKTEGAPVARPAVRTSARNTAAAPTSGIAAPNVRLEALSADRTKPGNGDRNLFKFKPKPKPAPPAPPPVAARPEVPMAPPVPSGPPPPPPITLKFIGVLQSEGAARVAILSDGRGPLYGREGETVLGQYKILRIAAESIEMSYLDGRGRQTIRLSGS
jgi:hypothetical protein